MSFPDNAPDKYRTSGNSPYSGRYGDDWFESRDHLRDRSRSTFREEDSPLKGRKHSERDSPYYSGRHRGYYDLDDGKVSSLEKSGRHRSRDVDRDVERERGSSHSRYGSRDDRHQGRDGTGDRGVGKEIELGRKREERDRSRDRDSDKDRKRRHLERSTDRDLERDSRGEKQKEIIVVTGCYIKIEKVLRKMNGVGMKTSLRTKVKTKRGTGITIESRRNRGRERERENFGDLSRERSRRSSQEVSEDKKWAELRDVRNVNMHENYA